MNSILTLILSVITAITSPDGKLKVELTHNDDNTIYYSVIYQDKVFVSPSQLGLVSNEVNYEKLIFDSCGSETIKVDYKLDRIKKSSISHEATSSITRFKTPDGQALEIEWHISNNDVAYRYRIPREGECGSVRILRESTYFNFPSQTTCFLTPQSDPMVGWKRTKPSYEEFYIIDAPLGQKSEFGHGFTFPCLFKIGNDGWALVSETGVDSRYCGSRLDDYESGKGYRLAFPMMEENNGNGTVEPAFALPGATPWRTITIGTDLAPITESTIAFDVVKPRYETSYDFKYGKSTWSWIVWQDASMNLADQKTFIDLASEMGYPYTLVDAFWDKNIGRPEMERLVDYAKDRNVKLFLWYSSSGWWNDITQSPVDIMSDPIARKAEMKWMQRIGIKGIKVDFFGGDKQETMRLYESILSDANDHGLMVIFHGCTIPRGWERMYPNYVGSEAVRASENLVFTQHDCDLEAQSACLHPFIRNAVGSMEYGGTFLNKRLEKRNGTPDSRGRVHGTIRRTSDAFQLAVSIIYQNPIQHFAITPNNLTDAPAIAIDFLRDVPTVWDETKLISGVAAEHVVLARRNGSTWYVAAINALEEPLKLDVNAIIEQLGGNARVLATQEGELRTIDKYKKPLTISQGDGAVIILK